MSPQNHHGPLFRFASRVLKYYVLAIFGFMIAVLLSVLLGLTSIARHLTELLGGWFWQLGAFTFCLVAIAVIVESLRD